MATNLYGSTANEEVSDMFGKLPDSALTLFQLMTMDGWSEILGAVTDDGHPYAWIFFLVFIFVGSFAILNLFIALIVEALTTEQKAALEEQLEKSAVSSGVQEGFEEMRARDESFEDTLEHVEEELEEAETERSAILRTLEEMRGEIRALKDLLAARGS
jgi:voltage-gated sodium channel